MKLAQTYLKSYSAFFLEPITKWMKIKTKEAMKNKGQGAEK